MTAAGQVQTVPKKFGHGKCRQPLGCNSVWGRSSYRIPVHCAGDCVCYSDDTSINGSKALFHFPCHQIRLKDTTLYLDRGGRLNKPGLEKHILQLLQALNEQQADVQTPLQLTRGRHSLPSRCNYCTYTYRAIQG